MLGIKRLGLLAALALVGLCTRRSRAGGAAQPSAQDTQYLQAIHQVNLYEIAAGEPGPGEGPEPAGQGAGPAVRHGSHPAGPVGAGPRRQLDVELPDEPTADQQTALDQLNNASGAEFDRLWVTQGLAGHIQAIQATQTEISQGSEQPVVQLAQDALPVLQAHYDALVALAEELGIPVPETSASGTPSPGGTGPRLRG